MTLSTKICGIEFRNPTILAAGVMDTTVAGMRRAIENGAGGIVTKSIGAERREGHPNPVMVEVNGGFLNAVGLSNPGILEAKQEIADLKGLGVPIIASVFAGDEKGFARLVERMDFYGADMVELNLSCPHTKGYGTAIGTNPEMVEDVVSACRKATKKPVIAKLTPNVADIKELARAAEKGGASCISAINTLGPGMVIDVKTAKPVLSNRSGGMSGPAIFPIAVRCVYDIYETVSIPIIGIGGVTHGTDAVEMMMAGASAVGIGTAIHYRGVDVFKKVCDEVSAILADLGRSSVSELVGLAHEGKKEEEHVSRRAMIKEFISKRFTKDKNGKARNSKN